MKGHHVFFAQNSFTERYMCVLFDVILFLPLRYEMKLGVAYSPLTVRPHTTDQSHCFPRAVKVCSRSSLEALINTFCSQGMLFYFSI